MLHLLTTSAKGQEHVKLVARTSVGHFVFQCIVNYWTSELLEHCSLPPTLTQVSNTFLPKTWEGTNILCFLQTHVIINSNVTFSQHHSLTPEVVIVLNADKAFDQREFLEYLYIILSIWE